MSGRKLGSLFDGGDVEVDPKPFYSIFHAQRKKGNYQAALAAVRQQLEKFPTDFEGQMLLAELQAENLNDLPGAEVTIQRLTAQPGLAPANIASALNALAGLASEFDEGPGLRAESAGKDNRIIAGNGNGVASGPTHWPPERRREIAGAA